MSESVFLQSLIFATAFLVHLKHPFTEPALEHLKQRGIFAGASHH